MNAEHSKSLAKPRGEAFVASHLPDCHQLHPILYLPAELISLILFHCRPSSAELHPSKAPLLLTHICGAWRALALRTPELWASVAFKRFQDFSSANPDVDAARVKLHLGKLRWWLAQSAAHPLTLFLHCPQKHPAVPLVVAHAARWADVDLYLYPTALTQLPELELPLLQRLSLGCRPLRSRTDREAAAGFGCITAFANAPGLKHVSLLNLPLSAVVLPWRQLTELDANSAKTSDFVRVLSLAPALQRLLLGIAHWPSNGDSDPKSESAVVHGSLTSLILKRNPALTFPLSRLLDSALLILPFLSSLTLPPLTLTDIETLIAFASRCGLSHTLRELTLACAPLPRGAILRVLAPLERLEKLGLQFVREDMLDDILRALAAQTSSTPLIPRLCALQVDHFRGRKFPYALLTEVLDARLEAGRLEGASEELRMNPPSPSSSSPDTSVSPVAVLHDAGLVRRRSFILTMSAMSISDIDGGDAESALRELKPRGMSVSTVYVNGEHVISKGSRGQDQFDQFKFNTRCPIVITVKNDKAR